MNYRFGPFLLDRQSHQLFQNGQPVPLSPKTYQLLEFLVEHHDNLVTKAELHEAIWAGTHVDDNTILQTVSRLRRVLNAGAAEDRYLQTVPRLGYRFTNLDDDTGSPAAGAAAKRGLRWPTKALGLAVVAGLLAGVWWLIALNRSRPGFDRFSPLATLPGIPRRPSFSPDGSRVLFTYSSGAVQDTDVYEIGLDGRNLRQLTNKPGVEHHAVWAPNGEQIAFIRDSTGPESELVLLDPATGKEKLVASRVNCQRLWQQPACFVLWLPGTTKLVLAERASPADVVRLVEIDPATGERKAITDRGDGNGELAAAVSPDGKRLAHVRWGHQSETRLCIYEFASRRDNCLEPSVLHVYDVKWLPGGREILLSGVTATERGLWRVQPAQGSAPRPVLTMRDKLISAFDVSPADSSGRVNIVAEHVSARTELQVTSITSPAVWHAPAATGSSRDIDPHFSPGGSQLAFASDRNGSTEIWICGVDGSGLRQITHEGGDPGTPRWSPDGRFLAYDRVSGLKRDIFVAEVAARSNRPFAALWSSGSRPSWSRDGRWIYFSSDRSGSRQIWKIRPDGQEAIRLTSNGGYEPLESSDGREVYYLRSNVMPGLWSVPATGGPERLVRDGIWQGLYAVGPQGIFFAELTNSQASAVGRILLYEPATRSLRTVVAVNRLVEADTPSLAVSADGQQLALVTSKVVMDLSVFWGFR